MNDMDKLLERVVDPLARELLMLEAAGPPAERRDSALERFIPSPADDLPGSWAGASRLEELRRLQRAREREEPAGAPARPERG